MTMEPLGIGTRNETRAVLRDMVLAGGCVNRFGARHVPDGACYVAQNVDLSTPQKLPKRSGYVASGSGASGLPGGSTRCAGLVDFNVTGKGQMLVAAYPGSQSGIFYLTSPESPSGWGRATVDAGPVTGNLSISDPEVVMFQGNGLLWILPGSGRSVHAMSVDGKITDCGDEVKSPPLSAVDGTYLLERVWLLVNDQLHWSRLLPAKENLDPPDAFQRTQTEVGVSGGFVHLSTERGARPVALRTWRDRSLICFFEDHLEEFIVDSSNPVNSTRNVMESEFGCLSRKSIVVVGDVMYFLANDGRFRGLQQTITGAQRGIIPTPFSEAVREELPGRLNFNFAHRVQAVLHESCLKIFYPRDDAEDLSHAIIWSFETNSWVTVPAEYADSFSQVVTSNIDSSAQTLFAMGSTRTQLFRFRDGVYSDDGQAISVDVQLKAYDIGLPEIDKRPDHVRWRVYGDVGAKGTMSVRTGLGDDWMRVMSTTVAANSDSSFPLNDPDDFPLVDPDDFPLIDAIPQSTSEAAAIPDLSGESDLPIGDGDLPITDDDLPIYDGTWGVDYGPLVQLRFEESSTKNFVVEHYAASCALRHWEGLTTDG